jgi:ribose transport system substrate-binding protein
VRPVSVLIGGLALALAAAGSGVAAETASKPLVPAQISATWLKWNKQSCSFQTVPKAQHPKTWTASLGKASPGTLIGYAAQAENQPFAVAVNDGVAAAAKTVGADFFKVNYLYPDTAAPIAQSQVLISKKPTVAITFNSVPATIPSMAQLFKSACIPDIQISFPAQGSVLFGASNESAGQIAGNYLVKLVQSKKWNPSDVTLIGPTVASLGPVNKRITECASVFQKALPKSHYAEVPLGATTATGQAAVTDWLTAHPAGSGTKYLVSCTIADIWSLAVANALTSSGRAANSAVIGQGASLDGVKAIRSGDSPIVASVWFDAGHYGSYLVPLALDVLAGKPVPAQVHQKLFVVDKTNADKFYVGS